MRLLCFRWWLDAVVKLRENLFRRLHQVVLARLLAHRALRLFRCRPQRHLAVSVIDDELHRSIAGRQLTSTGNGILGSAEFIALGRTRDRHPTPTVRGCDDLHDEVRLFWRLDELVSPPA